MVLDRKTLLAAAVLAVLWGSRAPFYDTSPLQTGLLAVWSAFVVCFGVSERCRTSRLVNGAFGVSVAVYGGYLLVTRRAPLAAFGGVAAVVFGSVVALYQSGRAPWGSPDGGET